MNYDDEGGFTLVEVAISIVVMAIVFIAISGLFNTLHQVNARANTLTITTQLAQKTLEQYRNSPYTSIAVGTTDISSVFNPYPSIGSPRSGTVTVTQVDPNGLKSVDITLKYTDHQYPKVVEVTTLIALNGINK